MPSAALRLRSRGFSMVEMLVALLFTGLLMAGMAQVFKSSLSTFTTSGEVLSAARRNRSSMDLLYDDLNLAGMYLQDIVQPPSQIVSTNPAFYILPNMPVAGQVDGPATADQLLIYFDQPLPFEGTLTAGSTAQSASRDVASGVQVTGAGAAAITTYVVDCGDPSYAGQIQPGMWILFKDQFEARAITTASAAGSIVTVNAPAASNVGITGQGSASISQFQHIANSRVAFFMPGQMVRFSVQMMNLDPEQPAGIPCLVREQGTYSSGGFVPATQALVTDNVAGFKVYLSGNSGRNWAGYGQTYSGLTSGWTNGIVGELNTQLAAAGRQDYTSTGTDLAWFRQIPVLVRADVTTRTAVKRGEYSATPSTPAYKNVTQSVVLVPRHFGLALTWK